MRCPTCPRPEGKKCLGERLPHLCAKPEYRDHLASYDDDAPPPTLLEKAGTALKAGARLIADGGRLSTEELRASRLAICAACPNMQGGVCSLCGCFLRVKVTMPLESCPDNPPRWGPA